MKSEYPRFRGDNPFASQAKMLLHMDRVQEWLMTGDSWPIFMEVNLTSACNLKCSWCISENFRSHDTLPAPLAAGFFRDFASIGGKALTFSGGGEPTLHPDFESLAKVAGLEMGLDLGLMTNGCYREDYAATITECFDWVRFSLDTVDRKKYAAWKGADWVDHVLENIHALHSSRIGKKPRIGVNCNVGPEHTRKDVVELIWAVEGFCDYIQFRPVLPRYFKGELPEINEKVWKTLRELRHPLVNLSDDKLLDMQTLNLFPFRKCLGHIFSPILNANGDVCVCMYHPDDKRFVFGNIKEQRLHEIWASERRRRVMRDVARMDYASQCQVCCKLTELNKFLDFVSHPEEMRDLNFL